MNHAYLLIGGNLGDRLAYLAQAKKGIEQAGNTLIQASSIYETAAWGLEDQPSFYNQALHILTPQPAVALMQQLLDIEAEIGRTRTVKMGPRIIDIDLLLFNDEIHHTPFLTVPHPRLPERRFALAPLAEIAGDYIHPELHTSIFQLLRKCTDTLDVHKINVAI